MTTPITLADGVFDPLHAEHVSYLELASHLDLQADLVVQVSRQLKRAEWLDRESRRRVISGLACVDRAVTYDTTRDAIEALRPASYVKGNDWRQGVPADEQALCDAIGCEVVYVNTGPSDSSTRRLRAWAHLEANRGVRVFDADALVQGWVPFNAEAQGYDDFNARVRIEADHPRILAELCHGTTILDVGCGPGHFVQMLVERGAHARGIDPYLAPRYGHSRLAGVEDEPDRSADVVVCREVLEHVPVREWGALLTHLFRVARQRVYLTTRHTPSPAHPFDLTDERLVDPSHITRLPQPFLRALCVVQGGHRNKVWEEALDWRLQGRVLVYDKRGGRA